VLRIAARYRAVSRPATSPATVTIRFITG